VLKGSVGSKGVRVGTYNGIDSHISQHLIVVQLVMVNGKAESQDLLDLELDGGADVDGLVDGIPGSNDGHGKTVITGRERRGQNGASKHALGQARTEQPPNLESRKGRISW